MPWESRLQQKYYNFHFLPNPPFLNPQTTVHFIFKKNCPLISKFSSIIWK